MSGDRHAQSRRRLLAMLWHTRANVSSQRLHSTFARITESNCCVDVILDGLLVANPHLFSGCFVHSTGLIEEGRDSAAAEEAARAVLIFVPTHAESRKNLDLVLLRRQAG
jgi:hypothetical protein